MATRRSAEIFILPFRDVLWPSGSSQIFIISRNIFVLLLKLMAVLRIHYSSFVSHVMCHYYIKKSYGPTERGIVT